VNPVDSLPVIAEISIGLVGFTAVVAVLRRPDDLFSSLLLLGYSSATLILALLPFLFTAMGAEPEGRWQLSSGAMFLCSLAGFAPYLQIRAALAADSLAPKSRSIAIVVLGLLNAALQLANVFGMFGVPRFWPFLLGLLWYLAFCLAMFASLLFLRPSE
jgi:hypothetical protein